MRNATVLIRYDISNIPSEISAVSYSNNTLKTTFFISPVSSSMVGEK